MPSFGCNLWVKIKYCANCVRMKNKSIYKRQKKSHDTNSSKGAIKAVLIRGFPKERKKK